MRSILPADCARARQQLSLRVDSELSEFELVLLEAHLGRCEDCRAFEQGVTGMTAVLRTVPVEEPSISFMPPRRRARTDAILSASLRAGSAAAAIAVVAISGLIALNGSTSGVAAVDVERARSVLSLHERQLQQMETSGQTRTAQVPRGLAAAERALAISGQVSATVREGGRAAARSNRR
jgi:predicted anti-sigma-YlaC factor YlaD